MPPEKNTQNACFRLTIPCAGKFLRFPASRHDRPSRLTISCDGRVVRRADIFAPMDDERDYWLLVDVSDISGETLDILIEDLPHVSGKLEQIAVGNNHPEMASLYHERLRPQFHFSPRSGWSNDPNGMVHVQGEWHLYFQYNAFGVEFGNQCWGHAVSRDLVHWEELAPVLQPDVFFLPVRRSSVG